MKSVWTLHDAKNRFSALVDQALGGDPQMVTRHGKRAVVIIRAEDFERLTSKKERLVTFFRHSPLKDIELDLSRDGDSGRDISL